MGKRNSTRPGISRIDSIHTHGWYVRVYANGGVFFSKLFSDRKSGGKDIALQKAVEYQKSHQKIADQYKREGRNPRRKPLYNSAPKNNKSGLVGVNEVKTTIRGRLVHYFQATWSMNGQAQSAKYYISKKRTRDEAFELAKKLRLKKEKEVLKAWKKNSKEMLKADSDRVKAMKKADKELSKS